MLGIEFYFGNPWQSNQYKCQELYDNLLGYLDGIQPNGPRYGNVVLLFIVGDYTPSPDGSTTHKPPSLQHNISSDSFGFDPILSAATSPVVHSNHQSLSDVSNMKRCLAAILQYYCCPLFCNVGTFDSSTRLEKCGVKYSTTRGHRVRVKLCAFRDSSVLGLQTKLGGRTVNIYKHNQQQLPLDWKRGRRKGTRWTGKSNGIIHCTMLIIHSRSCLCEHDCLV